MAQGLGEYGGLVNGGGATQISTGFKDVFAAVEDALRHPTPKTWLMIGAFFFVLWFLFIRRK
jgi:hypothetical protein